MRRYLSAAKEAFMSYSFNRGYNPFGRMPRASAVNALIIANVAVFAIQMVIWLATGVDPLPAIFGNVPYLITTKFFLWQFVTSLFVHGGVMHILFNMLGLYFFGRELEWLWG